MNSEDDFAHDYKILFEWKRTEKGYWVKVTFNNGHPGFLSFSHEEFERLANSRIHIDFKPIK